ncbi:hypothetical protein EVC45_02420 [Paraburkholderia sp. UYCP14C]|uniref:phage tail fiber protein n=1 Tax=Paraburkholderia sp. UYCP14C TaxID=2511130 RepID=UPI00101FE947|nr:hypothetical protein [Paraburkholderia sp. UYCP14C]RZF31327.1 hypothetical protein EVC45_02420 [Paraburkholderia sp. UYCP14C]
MREAPIRLAIAAARKGVTRDGLVTIEYPDVLAAANAMGMALKATATEVFKEVREMGGKRVANYHGARYGIPQHVLERSTNGEPGVNHLGGEGLEARLTASLTYPRGITITEFSHDYAMSAADLCTVEVAVIDPDGARLSQGAVVSLNLVPGSDAANALRELVPSVHNVTPGRSVTSTAGADRVALGVRFPDGSTADLSGGSLICRHLHPNNAQFTFFFSDVNRDN